MSPEQRPADEDEIKRAEREDTPETIEQQRPATEEEIREAEKEAVVDHLQRRRQPSEHPAWQHLALT